ncbi:hypothetical protein [Nostoc sp.]|uniref:hypothetical protein n=1 Tax=Nostoc sp. TaxID=1180 RepID=UPI002FFA54E5
MPTAIVGDDAIALRCQEQRLDFPAISIKRPAVRENNCGPCSLVLVVYLRTVFGSDCTHVNPLYIESKDNCLKAIAHVEFVENYNRQLLLP